MSLLVIPTWTIPPDWADPVIETLEWLTGIMVSTTGVEQRQCLRASPRRSFEFTVRPTGLWRTYADNLLSTVFQTDFYLPAWHEFSPLSTATITGDDRVVVKGDRTELKAANVLFIQGNYPWSFEITEVTSVSVSGGSMHFTVADELQNDWPIGTLVYPCNVAMLSEQPQVTRLSDEAWEMPVKFDLNQKNDWTGATPTDTYRGFYVLDLTSNYGDTQNGSYFRYNQTLDGNTGLRLRRDIGGIPFNGSVITDFTVTRAQAEATRSLLYFLRGRLCPVWLTTGDNDFQMFVPSMPGATVIIVDRSGFTDLGGPGVGRQDIRILLRDGTRIYRRIIDCDIGADPASEVLTLDSAVSYYLHRGNVVQISFMGVGRLDQDAIELTHDTDADGVMHTALATKAVPDLRDATDWTPEPFPPGTPGDCGPTGPMRLYFRKNDGPWNGPRNANPSNNQGGINISGLPFPLFPLLGFNTGFFGEEIVYANFAGTPVFEFDTFKFDLPEWASPWGDASWDDDHKGAGITIVDGVGAYAEGEVTGAFVRATNDTGSRPGLKYWELNIAAMPQNVFVGFADAAFGLNSEGTGNYVVISDNGVVTINGFTTGLDLGEFAEGDTFCVAIYTEVA